VLIFATGGTIGMRASERGLAPDPQFPEALERAVAAVCGPLGARFRINHLNPPVDSANADADTAPRIARTVGARVRTIGLGSEELRGVVILHGTDTLAYTGARLAFELAEIGVPVVLTGSQEPLGAPESDAPANLSLAIKAALRARADAPVAIAFGGSLIPAVRASKYQAVAAEGFRAERALADGAVGTSTVRGAEPRSVPARVLSFRFVPGVLAEDLRGAASGEPDALVLECYGTGNGPTARPGVAEALREVCERMPVVAVTQCATGGVDFARYAAAMGLAEAGVIDGGDMTLEAALAKLAFCLDRGVNGEALRDALTENLVGEREGGNAQRA